MKEKDYPDIPCPECGHIMGRMYKRDKETKKLDLVGEPWCDGCSKVHFYENRYREAILDALNVLGTAYACKCKGKCEGCEYERGEAQEILYASLGVRVRNDPSGAYMKIRGGEWHEE